MNVRSFGCEKYKAFKGKTTVEVRPLTLFFGKNNSGKSALIRLLRLLLRALSTRAARGGFPLQVDGLSYGGDFRDLIYGDFPHGAVSFKIAIEFEGQVLDLSAKVQNIQNLWPSLAEPGEYNLVSWLDVREPDAINLNWDSTHGMIPSYQDQGPILFRGLLPDKDRWGFINEWREHVESIEDLITHLGPLRASVQRIYERTVFSPILGFDGAGALYWLADAPTLLNRVSTWYEENLDGWRLKLDHDGNAFRCLLSRGRVEVNLADSGQGMQQILPVVVQQMAHQLDDQGHFLDLVEQPELHLHAAAQAPLGDLFLDAAKTGRGQVIVETHSENLLLRIRRRIAEGIDPALVALYWVDEHPEGFSTVRRINILRDGSVDWWPQDVFSEGYQEVRALRRAARAHGMMENVR